MAERERGSCSDELTERARKLYYEKVAGGQIAVDRSWEPFKLKYGEDWREYWLKSVDAGEKP